MENNGENIWINKKVLHLRPERGIIQDQVRILPHRDVCIVPTCILPNSRSPAPVYVASQTSGLLCSIVGSGCHNILLSLYTIILHNNLIICSSNCV